MPFFPNVKLELWEYSESDTYNLYGEAELTYNLIDTVSCDLQPMSTGDSLKEFGEILQDTYKTYLAIDTPVTDTMICRVTGSPDTYKVVGTPIYNNHLMGATHIKLILQKQRVPEELDG